MFQGRHVSRHTPRELVLAAQECAAGAYGNHPVEPRISFRNDLTARLSQADRMACGWRAFDQKSPTQRQEIPETRLSSVFPPVILLDDRTPATKFSR